MQTTRNLSSYGSGDLNITIVKGDPTENYTLESWAFASFSNGEADIQLTISNTIEISSSEVNLIYLC